MADAAAARLSPTPRTLRHSSSRSSIAASDTTYHSFHDTELYEPTGSAQTQTREALEKDKEPVTTAMQRQDSGYESLTRRPSESSARRRGSTVSSSSGTATTTGARQPKRRPSARRASRSSPCRVSYLPQHHHHYYHWGGSHQHLPLQYPARCRDSRCANHLLAVTVASGYFHFPTPVFNGQVPSAENDAPPHEAEDTAASVPPQPPPPTTHYWTSDATRRLEYAAIDAASRGVKGWVLRHVVPDCFVPRSSSARRHVGFDDDCGSVRRYRLELPEEEAEEAAEDEAGDGYGSESVSGSDGPGRDGVRGRGMDRRRQRQTGGWKLWGRRSSSLAK